MRAVFSLLLLFICSQLIAQVYDEGFAGQEGYGIRGACDLDPLSCDTVNIPSPSGWTITGDASGMLNAEDHFIVVNDELRARDTDGELCFVSPVIDLTGCDTTQLSLFIEEVGDLETSDYVDVYFVADTAMLFVEDFLGSGDSSHTLTGDFPDDNDWQSVVVELVDIVADSGVVRVCASNNSGTESIRLDDIEVSCQPGAIPPQVYINEVDCDQEGIDTAEFVELAGPPETSLDFLMLVLYNGSDDASYAAYELIGEQLNSLGLFTICFGDNNAAYCDLVVDGQLQNGADGIGLYYAQSIDDFPNNTPLTTEGLIDGLRYATGELPDTGLALLDLDVDCPENCQIDEEPVEYSIQRGSWFVASPTPGAVNADPLAVEWLNFTAKYRDGVTHLAWSTSAEHHNAYFSIEYARDRNAFGEVGRVDGSHTSRTVRSYHWIHRPSYIGENHYYRVRSVDVEGNSDYTGIRGVDIPDVPDVVIRPTFARSSFRIFWPEGEKGDLTLFNASGCVALRKEVGMHGYCEVDVSELLQGVYIAHFTYGSETFVRKIAIRP